LTSGMPVRETDRFFFACIDQQSKTIYRSIQLIILGVLFWTSIPRTAAAQTPLDRYVEEGLSNSPALGALSYESALEQERFREAKRAYLPSVTANLRYTRSGGGRTIEFPVGDLLNPVYEALNDFTGTNAYPHLENESIRFLREKEQESKLSLVQPLFLPAARPVSRALSASADAKGYALETARRDLKASIQDAYLGYHQALDRVAILEDAVARVVEAERVTDRLLESGLATNDELFRIRAERSRVAQELAGAETMVRLAAAAFNTLLSRPTDASIDTMDVDDLVRLLRPKAVFSLTDLEPGLAARSELAQLDAAIRSGRASTQISRGAYLPQIVLVGDAGIQGERYTFASGAAFRTASVVLSWTLFDGKRRSSRVEQGRLAEVGLATRREALMDQFALELRSARWEAQLSQDNISVAEHGLESARSAFRLMSRRYQEGMATVLDLLDSRATLTTARQQLNIARFASLRAWVELRRVSPSLSR